MSDPEAYYVEAFDRQGFYVGDAEMTADGHWIIRRGTAAVTSSSRRREHAEGLLAEYGAMTFKRSEGKK